MESWSEANLGQIDHCDTDAACKVLVAVLGAGGWFAHAVIDPKDEVPLGVLSLCLIRETLARHDELADFDFAMQGLGTGAISLLGSAK